MESYGWTIHTKNDDCARRNKLYAQCCNTITFWGYNKGNSVGYISTTFKGSATATLDFGNCWIRGFTRVFINDKKIGRADPNIKSKVITFNYKPGDILRIEEIGGAIIKINSLQLSCASDGKSMSLR